MLEDTLQAISQHEHTLFLAWENTLSQLKEQNELNAHTQGVNQTSTFTKE